MKTLLIFGFGGFVGPYLAEEFIKDGYKVIGSDINDSLSTNNVDLHKCNILDGIEVKNLILDVKPDIIINLAAISSVGQSWKIPQTTMSVNVIGSLNILEAAKELDKKPRIMFVGSSEEYEISDKPMNEKTRLNANNPYGVSKVTQERFAEIYREQFGLKIYCVRPFNHTGIGQRDSFVLPSFCKQVAEIEKTRKNGTIYVGNLEVYRDFSDVRDIVRAYKMIIESNDDKTIFNVGSGTAYSLKELLNYIISLSSQRIEVVVDKDKYRPADNKVICCDSSLIKKELSWEPTYNIKDTLKDMYLYFLNK